MNKSGSSSDQLFRWFLIAFIAFWAYQQFFVKPKTEGPVVPPRTAPALVKAFAGIDPAQPPALNVASAKAEIKTLEADIAKNPTDARSNWSKLRIGLIRQYITGDLTTQTRKTGFLGWGATQTYYPAYDEVVHSNSNDAVEAQAIYQVGDLQWRTSTQGGKAPSSDAATTLESLVHKGRASSVFQDQQIFVPKQIDPAKVPLQGPPPEGFRLVKVHDLRGSLQGIPDRLITYYGTSTVFRVFDGVVKAFGAVPSYSYGLAILAFAVVLRVVMHPIYKRQYDSMKGMAVIAPEMKLIQAKYKGKTDQASQMAMVKETQALQRLHGVNPMMGCALALLQMPVFFFIVYPMIQHYDPKMELVGASFLWIQALARPDWILLIFYGISMFVSFKLSATPPTDDMQRQQQLLMAYAMPVMLFLFMQTQPASFTLYWMTYNIVSTAFQWQMVKAADPKKRLVATLFSDLKVQNPTADAVPERPAPKTEKPSLKKAPKIETLSPQNGNGHSNGNGNGSAKKAKPQAAPEGAVLESLEPLQNSDGIGKTNGSTRKSRKK